MRITNSMMTDNMLRNLNNGLSRVNTYHNQLASNRRIVRLSDDPIGVLNSMGARQQIRRLEQYQKNVTASRAWVQQTETAVTEMEQQIISAKELLTDAMGTENNDDKKIFAKQIREVMESILDQCNGSMGDRYMFGGFNVTKMPFTAERDETGKILSVKYNGLDLTGMQATFEEPLEFNIGEDLGIQDLKWNGQLKNVSGAFTAKAETKLDENGEPVLGADGEPVQILRFTEKNPAAGTDARVFDAVLDGFPEDPSKLKDGEKITVTLRAETGEEFGTVSWVTDTEGGTKDPVTQSSIANLLTGALSNKTVSSSSVTNQQIVSGPTTPKGLEWTGTLKDTSQKYTIETDGSKLTLVNSFGTVVGNVDIAELGPEDKHSMVMDDDGTIREFTVNLIDHSTGMDFGTITYRRDPQTDAESPFPAEIETINESDKQIAFLIGKAGFVTSVLGEEATQNIQYEIGYNMDIDVTFTGIDLVGTGEDNLFNVMINLANDLEAGMRNEDLTHYLTKLTVQQDRLLESVMKCGNRTTRLDTMVNRYSLDAINYEAERSNIEDIDQAQVITQMKYAEMIYKQALASGAQIIQPTLMDFLR